MVAERLCLQCGNPVQKPKRGPTSNFCSLQCRKRAKGVRLGRTPRRSCTTCRFWLAERCHLGPPTADDSGKALWPQTDATFVCSAWLSRNRTADPAIRYCLQCGKRISSSVSPARKYCSLDCRRRHEYDQMRGRPHPKIPVAETCESCEKWSAKSGQCRAVSGRRPLTMAGDWCGGWKETEVSLPPPAAQRSCARCGASMPGETHGRRRYCTQNCKHLADCAAANQRRREKRHASKLNRQ